DEFHNHTCRATLCRHDTTDGGAMKWLKRGMLAIATLILLLFVVGMLLPSKFKVQRTQQIAAPAARIYPLIAEPRQWKNWAIWNQRDPTMAIQYSGPESGAGARWSWQSKTEGNGSMEFTAARLDQGIKYSLSFAALGLTSRGELRLVPDGEGTRGTWTNGGG